MKQNYPITILLALAFLIGCINLPARGEGWDERLLHKYADRSLTAYQTWMADGEVNITLDDLGGYGPSFLMLDELIFRPLHGTLPMHPSDIYHLINFVTFLAGMWAFYDLIGRWLNRSSAIGATAFFMAQPVFWGHAFMNSKDIPFLAFFLLSLTFGFRMMDSLKPIHLDMPNPRLKRTLTLLTALWLVSVLGAFAATGFIHALIEDLVRAAAAGETNIISSVASNIRTAPPEIYIQKFMILFLRVRLIYSLLFTCLLVYLYHRHARTILPAVIPVLLPAFLLGFTTSVRILGPFAGLIVAAYGLRTKGRKAIPTLIVYLLLAVAATYLTWPYLWEDPIGHFIESLRLMSAYPWNGQVLFNGQRYSPADLPVSYLPVLFGIQLTEPVWILFLFGFAFTVMEGLNRKLDVSNNTPILLELILLWFVVPILGFIVLRPSLYDNFRQLFFLLPPIFFMAGFAFSKVKQLKWQLVLILFAILPGIVDGIRLHPYEYIYYNRFVGGVNGAQRRFELDYWVTSYRETAEYMNNIAEANSYIWVEGPAHLFNTYARDDLKVLDAYDPNVLIENYYLVTPTRHDIDLLIAPDAEVVYTVLSDGAPLAVIKKLKGSEYNESK